MHYPMFSHAPEPVDQQHQHNGEERTAALYVESTLEPHEAWAALTEYIHLWWPRQLLQREESHIDLSTELLLEETADGDIIPVARIIQCENEDVLTIGTLPGYTPGAPPGRSRRIRRKPKLHPGRSSPGDRRRTVIPARNQ